MLFTQVSHSRAAPKLHRKVHKCVLLVLHVIRNGGQIDSKLKL